MQQHQQGRRQRKQQNKNPLPTIVNSTFVIPTSLQVRVSSPREWMLDVSLQTLIRHWLYARGLWPVSADQVETWMVQKPNNNCIPTRHDPNSDNKNEESTIHPRQRDQRQQQQRQRQRQLRNTAWNRRMVQGQTALAQFLQDVSWFVNQYAADISYVVISIGSGWFRPKECYLLDVRQLCLPLDNTSMQQQQQHDNDDVDDTKRLEHALSRRLLRHVMTIDETVPHPSKMASSFQLMVTFGLNKNFCNENHRPPPTATSDDDDSNVSTAGTTTSSRNGLDQVYNDNISDTFEACNTNSVHDMTDKMESCNRCRRPLECIFSSHHCPSSSRPQPLRMIVRRDATLDTIQASCYPNPLHKICLATSLSTTTTTPLSNDVMDASTFQPPTPRHDDDEDSLVWISLQSSVRGFSLK